MIKLNFEKHLQDNNISYYLEGDTFIIDHKSNVYLNSLTSLPDKVVFNNQGNVYLYYLTSLPSNKYEIFKNNGIVKYNNYNNIFDPRIKETVINKKQKALEKEVFLPSITIDKDALRFQFKDEGVNLFWVNLFSPMPSQNFQNEILTNIFKAYNECIKNSRK